MYLENGQIIVGCKGWQRQESSASLIGDTYLEVKLGNTLHNMRVTIYGIYKSIDRKTDWQTDRQTDRQTNGRTDGQRLTDWRTDGRSDRLFAAVLTVCSFQVPITVLYGHYFYTSVGCFRLHDWLSTNGLALLPWTSVVSAEQNDPLK